MAARIIDGRKIADALLEASVLAVLGFEVDREDLRELTDRAHYAHRLGVRKTDHARSTRIHTSNK